MHKTNYMKLYLLPIGFMMGGVLFSQTLNLPVTTFTQGIQKHHKYLLKNSLEIDVIQAQEQWLDQRKYIYDDSKDLKEIHVSAYSGDDVFELMEVYELAHDERGRVVSSTEKVMQNGQFVRYRGRETYTYDDRNYITNVLIENYDPDTELFEYLDEYKFEYENPRTNKPTKIQRTRYCSGQQCAYFEDFFTYDADGKLLVHSKGTTDTRREYTYENDKVTGYIEYREGVYTPYRKEEWAYDDEKENIAQVITYSYMDEGFVPAFRFVYNYDKTKLNDETYFYQNYWYYTAEYNWYPNKHVLASEKLSYWDNHEEIKEFIETKRIEYTYVPVTTLNLYEWQSHSAPLLVPNPATDYFQVNFKTQDANLKIYDVSGRLVKEFTKKQHRYDITSLKAGWYLVVMKDGGSINLMNLLIKK